MQNNISNVTKEYIVIPQFTLAQYTVIEELIEINFRRCKKKEVVLEILRRNTSSAKVNKDELLQDLTYILRFYFKNYTEGVITKYTSLCTASIKRVTKHNLKSNIIARTKAMKIAVQDFNECKEVTLPTVRITNKQDMRVEIWKFLSASTKQGGFGVTLPGGKH